MSTNKVPAFQRKLNIPKVKRAVSDYLTMCETKGKMPLWVEFAYSLGVSDETLNRYYKMEDYKPILDRVRKAEEVGLNRKLIEENKPVGSIFLLKARHQYREAQDVNINVSGDLGVVMLPGKGAKPTGTKGNLLPTSTPKKNKG